MNDDPCHQVKAATRALYLWAGFWISVGLATAIWTGLFADTSEYMEYIPRFWLSSIFVMILGVFFLLTAWISKNTPLAAFRVASVGLTVELILRLFLWYMLVVPSGGPKAAITNPVAEVLWPLPAPFIWMILVTLFEARMLWRSLRGLRAARSLATA